MSRKLTILSSAAFLCCLPVLVAVVRAQGSKPVPPKRVPCNCAELRFTLKPGASQSFILPAAQIPIRVDVSFSLLNAGTQEPSELMSALINQDSSSQQLTWIGTSSDGSSRGSTSLNGSLIASIFGGAAPTTNASLEVVAANTRTIAVKQNAATTALPGHYIVHLSF